MVTAAWITCAEIRQDLMDSSFVVIIVWELSDQVRNSDGMHPGRG